jgi:hypothetical protein
MYTYDGSISTTNLRRSGKMLDKSNLKSKAYGAGTTIFKKSNNRGYLLIYAEAPLTIELGEGGGLIPLAATGYYEPLVAPISEVKVIATGNFVIASNSINEQTP